MAQDLLAIQPFRSLSRRAVRCASSPLEPGVLPELAFAQIEEWLAVTSADERRAASEDTSGSLCRRP